jgi:AmmeMemoRadiSam system protein B
VVVGVRAAAVAGEFYPADPGELAGVVDGLLAEVPAGDSAGHAAGGYLVPHGGYGFSGVSAAHAYAGLWGTEVTRVVLLGPAHFVLFRGCRLSGAPAWASPLGEVPVDLGTVRTLTEQGLATVDDRPHRPEHALEVQLPFLQRALSDFTILPIAVGVSDVDSVARVLLAATAECADRTVVICSSDLSHHLDEATAAARDERTLRTIEALDTGVNARDACGVYAVRGMLGWARAMGLTPRVLHRSAGGSADRVVGYAAVSFSATER